MSTLQCCVYVKIMKEIRKESEQHVAQLSQRDCAAGWVRFGQKWKTVMGRQYFADIIGLSLTTVT